MDVVGGFVLADGRRAKALTGVDDHSRYCISAHLMLRESSRHPHYATPGSFDGERAGPEPVFAPVEHSGGQARDDESGLRDERRYERCDEQRSGDDHQRPGGSLQRLGTVLGVEVRQPSQ